jgi:hypothetical protein
MVYMFSVEFDHDEFLITVLDDSGNFEDVSVYIYDDIVYIRQWCEDNQNFDLIQMTPEMFDQIMTAMKTPEGVYKVKYKFSEK